MSKQEVILCESLETSLGRAIELCPHEKLFVLTDEHTQRLCLPSLKESGLLKDAVEICIGAKAPISFFSPLKMIPVLPPTDASTIASRVVGILI